MGDLAGLFVHQPISYGPVAASEHHPPGHSVTFLGPQYIALYGQMAKGQQDLDREIGPEHPKDHIFVCGRGLYGNELHLFRLQKDSSDGTWIKEKDHECQGEVGKDPDLEDHGIEKMEKDGQPKGPFATGPPEHGRDDQKVEKDSEHHNDPMRPLLL